MADDASSPSRVRVPSIDFAWLRMDEPGNLMQINGVLVLRERVGMDDVQRVLGARLASVRRFRQRVARSGRGAVWEDDPRFHLDRHLHHHDLRPPADDAALRDLVDDLMGEPLPQDRPLWAFHVIDGFRGGSAVVVRLHHCIGDGMGLLMVLLALTDRTPQGSGVGEPPNPFLELFDRNADFTEVRRHAEEVMPDGIRLMLLATDAMRSARRRWLVRLGMPGALLRLTFRPADPKTPLKGALMPEKRVAWSDPVPIEDVRRLGRALGGTVNDVLVAAMAGGLGRYLAERGVDARGLDLRAAMPVNLRPLEDSAQLGNRFGLMFLALPVGIADPRARLAELRRRALALKRSAEPFAAYGILRALGAVPHWLQKLVVRIFGSKATMVFTNVPGPRERLFFAGRAIDDIFFWVPQSGRLGLGISILSYAGAVKLGVATDAGLVPDPERIVAGFHAELEAMVALAGSAAPDDGLLARSA